MIIGSRIHFLRQTVSTMDECRSLARTGSIEGTVVSANFQCAGRGRFQRIWLSPSGENIQASILVRPKITELPYLNMAAALAASNAATEITGLHSAIKWPNDVELAGKKLCGILIESEISGAGVDFAIIGIGLNVNLEPERHKEIKNSASSLKQFCGRYVSRSQTFHVLLKHLNHYYERIKAGESLTSEWASKLNVLGCDIQISFPGTNKPSINCRADSLNEDGSLSVRVDDGSMFTATAGEVTLRS